MNLDDPTQIEQDNKQEALSTILFNINTILFKIHTKLFVNRSTRIKDSVKSQFGLTSNEYKLIKGLSI